MKIPRTLLPAAILAGLLCACAGDPPDPQWRKEGGTPEELAAAREHCMKQQERRNQQEALKSTEQGLRKYYYNQCMNEQGWFTTAAPEKAREGE